MLQELDPFPVKATTCATSCFTDLPEIISLTAQVRVDMANEVLLETASQMITSDKIMTTTTLRKGRQNQPVCILSK